MQPHLTDALLGIFVERLGNHQCFWKISCMVATTGSQTLVLGTSSRLIHGYIHPAKFRHHLIKTVFHPLGLFGNRGVANQVVLLPRISLEIKKLIGIPQAIVRRVFVFIAAQRKHGWCLWKVLLPVVRIKAILSP